ncbi:MAG TPA: IclR family transcriptional regulator C-terminal domain-containing protein [Xanthobacteraceae bacterium]|nr:IclR family transcriptional regulator C-terminal domain-containing protein [Xanthobacteraceae bacterium]
MEKAATPPITTRDVSLTFIKGMAVLKAFDAANTHLTLPQIARITGIDRAITRRLVLTLVQLGYVQQKERVFSLTPRILVLAGGFLQGRQFGKSIEPVLRAFAHRVGEGISMAMIDGEEAVYVAHAGSDRSMVSIGFTVGSRVPLLPTAMGRALLAFGPPAVAKDLMAGAPVQKFTPATVTDRAAIRKDIARVVERGYAFLDGEFEAGVAAVAVPVRTRGAEVAALGVSASSARFKQESFRNSVIETLNECSNAIGGLL